MSLFILPVSPATATFITEEERSAVMTVMKANLNAEGSNDNEINWSDVWSLRSAWHVLILSPTYFAGGEWPLYLETLLKN